MTSRFKFYILSYVLIFLMAILGLIFNIKTVAVNDRVNKLQANLQKLTYQNQDLALQIQEEERLDFLHEFALEQGYHLPQSIVFITTKE